MPNWLRKGLVQQVAGTNTETLCDQDQIRERNVGLTALDRTHKGAMHTDCVGESLLRHPKSLAPGSYRFPKTTLTIFHS
jgi:hypothetical protein